MRILNRLYAVFGWAIVLLGTLHMATTFRLTASSHNFQVWFFGSGIALVLLGALNLLYRSYAQAAPGLRIVCRSANLLLTLFTLVAGAVTGASVAEFIVVVGLLGGAFVLSFLHYPLG
jgi:hypothetical protein